MLEKRLHKGTGSRWIGAGLAGLLAMGTVLTPGAAVAQVTAPAPVGAAGVQAGLTRVHGIVTDPDGALIPGATVTLTPSGGPPVTAKSGSDGSYSAAVRPGTYTVVVSMPGSLRSPRRGLRLARPGA